MLHGGGIVHCHNLLSLHLRSSCVSESFGIVGDKKGCVNERWTVAKGQKNVLLAHTGNGDTDEMQSSMKE